MSVQLAERFPLPAAPPPQPAPQKDRFLAFAFAAADLLLEVTAAGRIEFAAGALKAWFGLAPEQVAGTPLHRLFAPADRPALDLALSTTALRGRLPPLVIRLSDDAATPMVLSGLATPSAPGRLCFTVGRLPSLPAPGEGAPAKPGSFARLAEARLQAGEAGGMGLVELGNWADAKSNMPASAQRALQTEILDVLNRFAGPGAVAGEIASGRYGVVADSLPDLGAIATELEALLRANPATARTKVHSTNLSLETDGLTGAQAARALRFALARFADGGTRAAAEAGFSNSLAEFIAGAQSRARTMRGWLADNKFRLAFQPVVSLHTQAVHHYEALLRPIITPGSGIANTQEYVTFAEAVGLSEELDWAVLQQAVAALQSSPGISVAVNVSGLSMQSATFGPRALAFIADRVQPGRLLLELTETADIDDVATASATIDRFRAAGVPVCLDDFGAGSAAFRYLREFRVDYVKLDGAYVRGALENAREHGFLLTMVELANFVGAKVIAETIEREEEANMMRDLGVEYGQGWLFGKPGAMPGSLGPRGNG